MKTLLIMRHGKSDWGDIDLDDFDRPLNERGKRNATNMGRFLHSKIGIPDLILASEANRAWSTAKLTAQSMDFPPEDIHTDENVYLASLQAILHVVATLGNETESCLLVGHNPGLTYLVNHLGVQLDNLPTASVACFEFNTDAWRDIHPKNATFKWLQLARELPAR